MPIQFPRCGTPRTTDSTQDSRPLTPPSPPNSLFDETDSEENDQKKASVDKPISAHHKQSFTVGEKQPKPSEPSLPQEAEKASTTPKVRSLPTSRKKKVGIASAKVKTKASPKKNIRAPVTLSSEEQARYYMSSKTPAWAGKLPDIPTIKKGGASTPNIRTDEKSLSTAKRKDHKLDSTQGYGSHKDSGIHLEPTSSDRPATESLVASTQSTNLVQAYSSTSTEKPAGLNTGLLLTPRDLSCTLAKPDAPGEISSLPLATSATAFLDSPSNIYACSPSANLNSGSVDKKIAPEISTRPVENTSLPHIPVCSVPPDFAPPPPPVLKLPPPPISRNLSPAELIQIAQSLDTETLPSHPAPLDCVSPTWLSIPLASSVMASSTNNPGSSVYVPLQVVPPLISQPLRRTVSEQAAPARPPPGYPQKPLPAYNQPYHPQPPLSHNTLAEGVFNCTYPSIHSVLSGRGQPIPRTASMTSLAHPPLIPYQYLLPNRALGNNSFSAATWNSNSPVMYAPPPLRSQSAFHASPSVRLPIATNRHSDDTPEVHALRSALSQSHLIPNPSANQKRRADEIFGNEEIQEISTSQGLKKFRQL